MRETERYHELMRDPDAVFVFGSNLKGIHGAGAARAASAAYGAQRGVGEGLCGRSYAIPTKKDPYRRLQIAAVFAGVRRFLAFARAHPERAFVVTRIGCGYAGFTDDQMAPLFADAPPNCILPDEWVALVPSPTPEGTP